MHTCSIPKEDVLFPRLHYCDWRGSQTCRQGSEVLVGLSSAHPDLSFALSGLLWALVDAGRMTQSALRRSEVFPNLSFSLSWYFCTGNQKFQLLSRPAGVPS
jgi:hypothetical protein